MSMPQPLRILFPQPKPSTKIPVGPVDAASARANAVPAVTGSRPSTVLVAALSLCSGLLHMHELQ